MHFVLCSKGERVMTDEQIKMLRRLIQDEIEVAGVDGMEHGVWGWMDSQLDKRWKEFQESFNSQEETEWNETGDGV